MFRRKRQTSGRLTVLALLLVSAGVASQDLPSRPVLSVDEEVLAARIAEVESSTTLGEDASATLLDLYRRALANLERARTEQAQADAYAAMVTSAPEALAAVNRALDEHPAAMAKVEVAVPESATLPELEQSLTEERARLVEAEARLSDLQERYAFEVARPALARDRLAAAHDAHTRANTDLNAAAPIGDSADLTQARRWHLETRAYRLAAEIDRLNQELLTHAVRLELLQAELDEATAAAELPRARVRILEDGINERGGHAARLARQAAETARQALEDRHPTIRDLATGNVELSESIVKRVDDVQLARQERDAVRAEKTRISEEFSSTQRRLEIAGLDSALGRVLVEHWQSLPDPRLAERRGKSVQEQIATVGLEQFELAQQRRELRDIAAYLDQLTDGVPAAEANTIRAELAPLAESRRALVRQSIETSSRYVHVLGELDLAQRELESAIREYGDFLAKRLLWIRNTQPVKANALRTLPDDLNRFFDGSTWMQFTNELLRALQAKPLFLLALAPLLLLGVVRRRILVAIDACSKHVGRVRSDSIRYSMKALAFTVLAAAPLPLIVLVAGLALRSGFEPATFTSAIASSLVMVGADLLIIQLFFDAVRDSGLAVKHCQWSANSAAKLRRELRWFRVVFPASRFIGETSFLLDTGPYVGGFAALALIVAAGSLGVLVARLVSPAGGILQDYLRAHADGVISRLRPLWTAALISVLPILIVLWLTGYNYTADVLAISFMYSVWLMLGLVLLQGFIARWLMLGYQRLALQAAIEKRDAARAAREAAEVEDQKVSAEEAELAVEEPEVDLAVLDSERRRLLRTIIGLVAIVSLWAIWAPIIPAIGILQDISLWTATRTVGGEAVHVPVTMADLLIAVLVAVMTGAAARGLPAFIEYILLQRTQISAGSRYTATTLLRYTIIGVGTIIVVGILGARWAQIQWLVAALGVGIGFGLQEIVANFISGLIILFERPIRIGDVVSVGNTSGVVTRINIRATTIRDWDRRELLVPNREFITGQLLNWSLSDSILRIVVPVGIRYGSDVGLAMKIAEEVALDNDDVLDDPESFVVFESFGDNAINLTLRAYVQSISVLMRVKTELHSELNNRLTEAGIVIAYPQRDVHLDTSRPLEISLRQDTTPLADGAV